MVSVSHSASLLLIFPPTLAARKSTQQESRRSLVRNHRSTRSANLAISFHPAGNPVPSNIGRKVPGIRLSSGAGSCLPDRWRGLTPKQ
ncbi:hypothetical protein Y88_2157 [Novosphingobium nitrogenifigens DSM 19370]|uniref:Uncharacterized protein n=1 Tax=Novosphingobium nitrogenifigens DSM 19370 TaxID=983920 RepID=F1Z5A3_9SPHN|nr:hypothetical protein Y88_2157 [Novosphingobium nitrogenifigens DSM 19370]